MIMAVDLGYHIARNVGSVILWWISKILHWQKLANYQLGRSIKNLGHLMQVVRAWHKTLVNQYKSRCEYRNNSQNAKPRLLL